MLYMDTVRAQLDGLGTAMNDIGEQFTQAGENPLLLFDQTWTFETTLSLLIAEAHLETLEAVTAPPFLQTSDDHLQAAVVHYHQFVDLLLAGMEEADQDAMLLAIEASQDGTADLNRADAVWRQLCE